jgi:hypothetical protein
MGRPYHVVYVVDCSGSMPDSFDLVRSTMHNSIAKLHENQQFRVISFGGQSGEPETRQLVRASRENKTKVAEFIRDVQPQGTGDLGSDQGEEGLGLDRALLTGANRTGPGRGRGAVFGVFVCG